MLLYEILFIQEISQVPTNGCGPQTSPTTCNFLGKLNNSTSNSYNAVVSQRVGSGNPEQYMVVYQTSKVELVESFMYNDTSNLFTRPPHIVKLRIKTIGNSGYSFYVSNIHTSPDSATSEILSLPLVATYIRNLSSISDPNIILIGDFNSDGSYFNERTGWPRFFNNSAVSNFTNLITNDMDTTVSLNNDYTYDRIVVSPGILSFFLNGSATPFYFDDPVRGFSLDNIIQEGCTPGGYLQPCTNTTINDAAKRVSDHYPVEIRLNFPDVSTTSEITSGYNLKSENEASSSVITTLSLSLLFVFLV